MVACFLDMERRCPKCKSLLDRDRASDGVSKPAPYDFTVCLYCQTILTYKKDMSLSIVSEDELSEAEHTQPGITKELHLLQERCAQYMNFKRKKG